jgi:hypothetical protein
LRHIDAVWHFRQIQIPEDGHNGPKLVVLSESEKIIICCITDGIDIHRLFNMSCNRMLKYRIVNTGKFESKYGCPNTQSVQLLQKGTNIGPPHQEGRKKEDVS